MSFIKQLGKPLSFVVLIGSAIFSASSASAQISIITTNTDVLSPATLPPPLTLGLQTSN
jgi:hypothetical protein